MHDCDVKKFHPVSPRGNLNGPYGDWILLMIFCGLFMAVSGAVLPRQLVDKRYGKGVVVCTGLILGIGLFKAKEIYNFNLESFGFLAIWLIIVILGFVIYGLIKIGVAKDTAVSMSYCIMFLSFFLLSPSMFDAIAESFPLVNLIFVVLFFYMIGKPLFAMVKTKNLSKVAKKVKKMNFLSDQDVEIDQEEKEDRKEIRDIKKAAVPVTKKEIKSVSDIKRMMDDIVKTVQEKNGALSSEDKVQIVRDLKQINQSESVLKNGMVFIRRHANFYNQHHRKDLREIHQRLTKSISKKQRDILQEEIQFHQTMLQAISFLDTNESKTTHFCNSFNSLIQRAIERLSVQNVDDAIVYLTTAKNNLDKMAAVYEKQKWFEGFIIKSYRRLLKDLKRERRLKE